LLETLQHGIEGAPEGAQFAGPADRDARREVALLRPAGGVDQIAEGECELAKGVEQRRRQGGPAGHNEQEQRR
jgi:hypothetical protein